MKRLLFTAFAAGAISALVIVACCWILIPGPHRKESRPARHQLQRVYVPVQQPALGDSATLEARAPRAEPFRPYLVSAYSHGCTNPRSGREPRAPRPSSSTEWPEANWSVAAPPEIPYGTVLELSYRSVLTTRIVHDRGPDIIAAPGKLPRLDLFVGSCSRATDWGMRVVWVRELRRPLGGGRMEVAR